MDFNGRVNSRIPPGNPLESSSPSLIIHDVVTVRASVRDARYAPIFFKAAAEGASRERKKEVGSDPAELMLPRGWSRRLPATWTLRGGHGDYIEL